MAYPGDTRRPEDIPIDELFPLPNLPERTIFRIADACHDAVDAVMDCFGRSPDDDRGRGRATRPPLRTYSPEPRRAHYPPPRGYSPELRGLNEKTWNEKKRVPATAVPPIPVRRPRNDARDQTGRAPQQSQPQEFGPPEILNMRILRNRDETLTKLEGTAPELPQRPMPAHFTTKDLKRM